MKNFWKDKIAVGSAVIGMVLMILTILWRVNRAEGSVIPGFLISEILI